MNGAAVDRVRLVGHQNAECQGWDLRGKQGKARCGAGAGRSERWGDESGGKQPAAREGSEIKGGKKGGEKGVRGGQHAAPVSWRRAAAATAGPAQQGLAPAPPLEAHSAPACQAAAPLVAAPVRCQPARAPAQTAGGWPRSALRPPRRQWQARFGCCRWPSPRSGACRCGCCLPCSPTLARSCRAEAG